MSNWWVTEYLDTFQNGKIILTSWVTWVVISITLHELAHGWMAIRCGDDVPIRMGHMTFNPLVHIPPMAWLMFALFGFTWGLMPVQPNNFRGRYDDAKVSFAGPAMNLLLFAICLIADMVWLKLAPRIGDPLAQNLHTFFFIGARINMMGFLFNLIPVPPLDGSSILSNFWRGYRNFIRGDGAAIGMIAMAVVFIVGGKYAWDATDFVLMTTIGQCIKLTGAQWIAPYF